MTKFPFTPEGVAAMCQHFYQLPDDELQAAAQDLAADFIQWVQHTFTLTESQTAYMGAIAPQAIAFMAANASFALANRRPIILAKSVGTELAVRESKLTKPKSKLAAEILPDGSFTVVGELVITITY